MGLFGALLLSHSSVYACIRRTRRGLASMRPILLVGPPNPHQPTMDDHTTKLCSGRSCFYFIHDMTAHGSGAYSMLEYDYLQYE